MCLQTQSYSSSVRLVNNDHSFFGFLGQKVKMRWDFTLSQIAEQEKRVRGRGWGWKIFFILFQMFCQKFRSLVSSQKQRACTYKSAWNSQSVHREGRDCMYKYGYSRNQVHHLHQYSLTMKRESSQMLRMIPRWLFVLVFVFYTWWIPVQ